MPPEATRKKASLEATSKKLTPKFDLEVTISSALIGLSNLAFDNQAVQGICSLLSPAVGHYSAKLINWGIDEVVKSREKKAEEKEQIVLEQRLEKAILFLEEEHKTALSTRKAEIENTLARYRRALSDIQMNLINIPELREK